ncbi:MAG TPA: hypothetical protein VKB77_00165, partial [Terriglobales bacterium]|nr:hypothetical protein [Terriglobales bacterium]
KKNDTINGFLTNPAAPEVDVDVRKVTLEQLRTAPYRASVDFYRAEYAPADRSILNLKKTIYTVTFVFMFKDQILQDLVEKICNFPCTVKLIATVGAHSKTYFSEQRPDLSSLPVGAAGRIEVEERISIIAAGGLGLNIIAAGGFREQHDLVGWVPGGKGKTPVVCATGVSHWWPDRRTSKFISESHPAMIGAGCPVLPLPIGAGRLLYRLSPARMPLSSLRHGVLPLSPL